MPDLDFPVSFGKRGARGKDDSELDLSTWQRYSTDGDLYRAEPRKPCPQLLIPLAVIASRMSPRPKADST